MLKWIDIIKFVNKGSPAPDRVISKSDEEWQQFLTPEQYRITRLKGTEKAHSSEVCSLFEPGLYVCVCCNTLLFDADTKYESGTGWPSFTHPIADNALAYYSDTSQGMRRVEAVCNVCQAHVGHVFFDGPEPAGLRYCINAVALKKMESSIQKATFGGGCFWCTEAIFQQIKGVLAVESGYSGGSIMNPTYREVGSGRTGHAEVIQLSFDPTLISYEDLLRIHLGTHTPTLLDQEARKTQYRSIILTHNAGQETIAKNVLREMAPFFEKEIATEVKPFLAFYKAEAHHQNYYASNPDKAYCTTVISPKLLTFKELFRSKIKKVE